MRGYNLYRIALDSFSFYVQDRVLVKNVKTYTYAKERCHLMRLFHAGLAQSHHIL